jgi:hypothetical protein
MPLRLRRAAAMADLSSPISGRALAGEVLDDPSDPISVRSLTRRQAQAFDLDAWLRHHPDVCNAIVWETPDGAKAYPEWSASRKADLAGAFRTAWRDEPAGLDDPPPNLISLDDEGRLQTAVSKQDAWELFKALVAQSLAVEVGDRVDWSLTEYDADQLARTLDGRKTFAWSRGLDGYMLDVKGVPAPPSVARSFLRDEGLVAGSRLETIGRVLGWCKRLVHFTGHPNPKQMEKHWYYRGHPPASRVISGTVKPPFENPRHYTGGCWGTTAFLHSLLRVVNVPVDVVIGGGHTMPHFMAEDRYLSHGDDPYSKLMPATPPIPPTELLIGPAKFDDWFGDHRSSAEQRQNVGRRNYELAVEYLPNLLVEKHCEDRAAGRSHADSEVADLLDPYYSVSNLENRNLWQRLDDKVARLGGCDSLPWED